MTPCLTCGTPCAQERCPEHTRRQRAKYGNQHQAERAAWQPAVNTGTVNCWRCGNPITTSWDLGHRDNLPSHPECDTCNRRAAALQQQGQQ